MTKIYNTSIPLNSELQQMYQLTIDSYTGLGGFYNGSYIDKYKYEPDYSARIKSTEYLNQVKGIVDSITNPCFTNGIERDNLNDYEEAFTKNCDNRGTTLTQFMNDVATWHTLIGNVFIVMDNTIGNTDTTIDAVANREFPYIYYKLGTEVESYKVNKHGKLVEISFYYETQFDKNGKEIKIYQHIDDTYTYQYCLKEGKRVIVGDVLESVTGGLPVIMTGSEVMPAPNMLSLATAARIVYNKGSELREIERTTNINILQLVGDKPEKGDVIIDNLVWVSDDATKDIKFVSPDPNIMAGTLASVQSASDDVSNIGKSYGAVPITDQAKSGVSYAYEFMGNSETLKATSETFEVVETDVFNMFDEFFTWTTQAVIKYNTEFTPGKTQLNDQMIVLVDTVDRDISPTLNVVCNQRIASITYVLGGIEIDEATMNKIDSEIEELGVITFVGDTELEESTETDED